MTNNCAVKLCFFDVLIDLCLLTTVLGGKNYIAFYHFILAVHVIIRDIVVIIVERASGCLVSRFYCLNTPRNLENSYHWQLICCFATKFYFDGIYRRDLVL